MLKKDYLSECFNRMWEAIIDSLCAYSEKQKAEELHRLRVEIKKISALAALLQFSMSNLNFTGILKPAKLISMKAGEIRNIQLTLRTIKYYSGKDSPLYDEQHSKLKKLTKALCLKVNLYVRSLKKAQLSVLNKTSDIRNICILNWYKTELKSLESLFLGKARKNMHESRKALKKLLYVYSILPKSLQKKIGLNKHYLHKLEETIGKWHDITVSSGIVSRTNCSNEVKKKILERQKKLLKSCCVLSGHFSKKALAG